MDWNFLARYGGLYTVLGGGGTVAVAYLLPSAYRGYALLGAIAVGALLIGKAVVQSGGGGPMTGGDVIGSSIALEKGSDDVFDPQKGDPSGAGEVFYAVGLVVFGVVALSTLL